MLDILANDEAAEHIDEISLVEGQIGGVFDLVRGVEHAEADAMGDTPTRIDGPDGTGGVIASGENTFYRGTTPFNLSRRG